MIRACIKEILCKTVVSTLRFRPFAQVQIVSENFMITLLSFVDLKCFSLVCGYHCIDFCFLRIPCVFPLILADACFCVSYTFEGWEVQSFFEQNVALKISCLFQWKHCASWTNKVKKEASKSTQLIKRGFSEGEGEDEMMIESIF